MTKKEQNKKQAKEGLTAFTSIAWDDYQYWQSVDVKVVATINDLIKHIHRDPFRGVGKPEGLKGDLSGYWSRRINSEHRLVYCYEGGNLYVVQCRYHY